MYQNIIFKECDEDINKFMKDYEVKAQPEDIIAINKIYFDSDIKPVSYINFRKFFKKYSPITNILKATNITEIFYITSFYVYNFTDDFKQWMNQKYVRDILNSNIKNIANNQNIQKWIARNIFTGDSTKLNTLINAIHEEYNYICYNITYNVNSINNNNTACSSLLLHPFIMSNVIYSTPCINYAYYMRTLLYLAKYNNIKLIESEDYDEYGLDLFSDQDLKYVLNCEDDNYDEDNTKNIWNNIYNIYQSFLWLALSYGPCLKLSKEYIIKEIPATYNLLSNVTNILTNLPKCFINYRIILRTMYENNSKHFLPIYIDIKPDEYPITDIIEHDDRINIANHPYMIAKINILRDTFTIYDNAKELLNFLSLKVSDKSINRLCKKYIQNKSLTNISKFIDKNYVKQDTVKDKSKLLIIYLRLHNQQAIFSTTNMYGILVYKVITAPEYIDNMTDQDLLRYVMKNIIKDDENYMYNIILISYYSKCLENIIKNYKPYIDIEHKLYYNFTQLEMNINNNVYRNCYYPLCYTYTYLVYKYYNKSIVSIMLTENDKKLLEKIY